MHGRSAPLGPRRQARAPFTRLAGCALLASAAAGQELPTLSDDAAEDVTAEGFAFVELRVEPTEVWVHGGLEVRARFGMDERFLQEAAIQLFRRELELPVQLQAPWLDGLPGCRSLPGPDAAPAAAREVRYARGGEIATASGTVETRLDGRRFRTVELVRRFAPEAPGELVLPATRLRFAYATRFSDDPLRGRVPLDRRDAFVRAPRVAVLVRELPSAGRPVSFTGAVGPLSIAAAARPTRLAVGDTIELAVTISGTGDLASFAAPAPELAGFRRIGTRDELLPGSRRLVWDLVLERADVREVPAVELPYFDPGPPPGYRTATTAPIPLEVAPRGAPPAEAPRGAPAGPATVPRGVPWLAWSVGLVLAAGAVLATIAVVRARRSRPRPPDRRRLAGSAAAAAAFARAVQQPEADVFAAWTTFLEGILAERVQHMDAPHLRARLVAGGLPAALVDEAVACHGELLRARYGGVPAAVAREHAADLVARLAAEGP